MNFLLTSCFLIVIYNALLLFELKKGKFKPADAGQLNFHLNVLDEKVKLMKENSSIGIVLCKKKNNTVVEFAIKSFDKAWVERYIKYQNKRQSK